MLRAARHSEVKKEMQKAEKQEKKTVRMDAPLGEHVIVIIARKKEKRKKGKKKNTGGRVLKFGCLFLAHDKMNLTAPLLRVT